MANWDAPLTPDALPSLRIVPQPEDLESGFPLEVLKEKAPDAEFQHVTRECPKGIGIYIGLAELDSMVAEFPGDQEAGLRIAYGETVLRLMCDAVMQAQGCDHSYQTSGQCPLAPAISSSLDLLGEPQNTLERINQVREEAVRQTPSIEEEHPPGPYL